MHADVGHGNVRLFVRHNAGHVHAERRRLHLRRQLQIDGAVPDGSADLSAVLHHAGQGIRMSQKLGCLFHIAHRNLLPDIRRADDNAVNRDIFDNVAADAQALALRLEPLRIALSAVSKVIVLFSLCIRMSRLPFSSSGISAARAHR